jgi:hypothetical protein
MTFSNVSVLLPGKKPERIVLACHHDTKCTTGHSDPQNNFHFVGANDGASATALLLALVPVLLREQREATIELAFFDGEESLDFKWNNDRALFGSKRYVKHHRDALLLGEESRIGAGVTYVSIGASADDPLGGHYETRANRTALTLEVPLVIAPSPNAAILVGPTLDLGIAGGDESTQESGGVTMTVKSNNKATDFGLQAGIAIAF